MKLRLMTYNLGWLQGEGSEGVGFKKRSDLHFRSSISVVAQTLKENNIDICAFQEIDFNSDKSHNHDQFTALKEKTQMMGEKLVCWNIPFLPFPYHRPWGKVVSGGAVLSKLPVKNTEEVLFDAPKNMFFLKRFFYLKRYIQVINVMLDGHEVKIFNLHLEAFDFKTKMEQLAELARLIRIHKPIAILGDFNTLPVGANRKVDIDYSNDPGIEELNRMMNSYQDVFTPKDLTFPTGSENCRLDYIWVRKDLTAKKISLKLNFNPSDHLPLALELSWKKPL